VAVFTRRSVNMLPQHMLCYLHDTPKSPTCNIPAV